MANVLLQTGKQHRLVAEHQGQAGHQQRVGVERHSGERHARHGESVADQAQQDEQHAGKQEQPARAVEQKETKRPPAVAEGAQVRCVDLAAVGVKRDRDLGDVFAVQRST